MTTKPTRPWGSTFALVALLMLALAVRIPLLASAEREFNSDEAVNALVLHDMLDEGRWTFYNWDATYYGVFESLLALPFVAALGWTALAFKLGSLVGFGLLLISVYFLGRRFEGPGVGLLASALLIGFSPEVVGWSARASGGYTLVVGWGVVFLLALVRAQEKPTLARIFLAGLLAGIGLYIYEIFLLWVALVPLAVLGVSFPWRLLFARHRAEAKSALASAKGQLLAAFVFTSGLALGWAPKLWVLATGTAGTKKPLYGLVDSAVLVRNLELLGGCIQALFGVNPRGRENLLGYVGPTHAVTRVLGAALLLLYAAAWAVAAWRVLGPKNGEIRGLFARPPRPVGLATWVVVSPLLPIALFVLSPNPQDLGANRYLLSWLATLPVLAAIFLTKIARRSRAGRVLAVASFALLLGLPLVQIAERYRAQQLLGANLQVTPQPEPLRSVMRFAAQSGVRGGYAGYWEAYEINFLGLADPSHRGAMTFASRKIWDRHPEDLEVVAKLPSEAYVFDSSLRAIRSEIGTFRRRLESARRPARTWQIGPFVLFTSATGGRLLPPPISAVPPRLSSPRAQLALTKAAPTVTAPLAELVLDLRVQNESDAYWSAEGTPNLDLRTAVGTRWLDEAGNLVQVDGGRSPLPWDLRPGESTTLRAWTTAPEVPGRYLLQITMIQENVAWFADLGGGEVRIAVEVKR